LSDENKNEKVGINIKPDVILDPNKNDDFLYCLRRYPK
jgi:hypothetical protein